jgi:transcriptional regulator with XRE-family HTH domain
MTQNNDIKLQIGIDYELLNGVRLAKNLTFEHLESRTGVSKDTIKNILYGRVKNPGVEKLNPICEELGVSIQKVLRQNEREEIENKGIKMDDTSIMALKEIYELQQTATKEINESHIKNIREHYERHIKDSNTSNNKIVEQYEKRIKEKNIIIKILGCVSLALIAIFVTLFIMEIMHPEHGWLRY